jgi:hypothetical protein
MNNSLMTANSTTHLKVVLVALLAAVIVSVIVNQLAH